MRSSLRTLRNGLTLVELLAVIAILVILAGAIVPMLMPDAGQQVRSGAQIVAADLAYTRGLAAVNGTKYALQFDIQNNLYKLRHTGTNATFNALPSGPMGSPADGPNERVVRLDEWTSMGGKVKLAAVVNASGAAVSQAEFGPLGSTTSTQQTVVWLVSGAGQNARYIGVTVNPVTGLATVGPELNSAPSAVGAL